MKLAIINDTHAGARNDSLAFDDYFFRFWDNVFFPYLKENNIDTVIHLGDIVDRRKFINYVILNRWRNKFFGRLKEMNVKLHVLVGNHDVPYKNTNDINAIEELFEQSDTIRVYKEPCDISIDNFDICLLPWINVENQQRTLDHIKASRAQVAFGHLEIAGFEMDRGNVCRDGMNRSVFDKFEMVLSGHFHHKSTDGHIVYLGNQYQMTWADYDDKRGFHVFDTDTRELTFVENPYQMFFKITYDDKNDLDFDKLKKLDFSEYTGTYVKILVLHKTNPFLFERFMQKLIDAAPLDISIVEDFSDLTNKDDSDIIDEGEDTMTILDKYVDGLQMDSADKLKSILRELYLEAINLEKV